ncbi:MAG: DUF1579 family protein [Planctomycetota bacterium]
MKILAILVAAASAAAVPFSITPPTNPAPFASISPQDKQPSPQDMAEMMAKMAKFTQPGKAHELLQRFLGEWETSTQITMGGQASAAEKGVASFEWLMKGRWIKSSLKGKVMGMPMESFQILGYDNFKQSYVSTVVGTMDTAMLRSEGDVTRDGKVLITYGTLDEYLTGEHDKMVKYVWRFVSDDEIVHEVHDLPIGEENTQVVRVRFVRKK